MGLEDGHSSITPPPGHMDRFGRRWEKSAARRHDSVAVRGRGGLIGVWASGLRGMVALCLVCRALQARWVAVCFQKIASDGVERQGKSRGARTAWAWWLGQSVADVSISRTAVSRHGESLVDEARIVEDGRDVL